LNQAGGPPDGADATVSSAGLRLRRAGSSDVAALLALEAAFPGDRLRRASLARFVASDSVDVWVAEVAGAAVGDAIVVYRRGFHAARLLSLVVAPTHRGRGVGAALLRHAERAAAQRGCVAMRLEVRVDNRAARRLYQAHGYQTMGTTAGYYEDGSAALRLRKRFVAAQARLASVPYYPQSLDFTCGPASLMMAMRAVGWSTPLARAEELAIWREATTVFMLSGHGGTSAHGLAVAARRRGIPARVWVSDAEVPFLDSVRQPEKKTVIALAHEAFGRELAADPAAVTVGDFGDRELVAQLRLGVVPVLLVSGWRFHAEKAPHWLVVTGWDERHVYVHDPFVPEGTERADAVHLPLARSDVARLARYGRARHRAMVLVGDPTLGYGAAQLGAAPEDAPPDDAPPADAPSEDAPLEDASSKDASSKDASSKDASSKDASPSTR